MTCTYVIKITKHTMYLFKDMVYTAILQIQWNEIK